MTGQEEIGGIGICFGFNAKSSLISPSTLYALIILENHFMINSC